MLKIKGQIPFFIYPQCLWLFTSIDQLSLSNIWYCNPLAIVFFIALQVVMHGLHLLFKVGTFNVDIIVHCSCFRKTHKHRDRW